VKIFYVSFGPAISCAYAPGYIQTFISLSLLDLSNREPSKKIDLCQLFCFDRFLPIFVFATLSLSFDHGTFGEVATVIYTLYMVVLS
jgi:hypothetical protein